MEALPVLDTPGKQPGKINVCQDDMASFPDVPQEKTKTCSCILASPGTGIDMFSFRVAASSLIWPKKHEVKLTSRLEEVVVKALMLGGEKTNGPMAQVALPSKIENLFASKQFVAAPGCQLTPCFCPLFGPKGAININAQVAIPCSKKGPLPQRLGISIDGVFYALPPRPRAKR